MKTTKQRGGNDVMWIRMIKLLIFPIISGNIFYIMRFDKIINFRMKF